ILSESGVQQEGADFYPAVRSPLANCAISGVVSKSNGSDVTWDITTANLIASSAPASGDFCSTFDNIANGQYVRYYRVYDPNPADSISEYRLVVVVLWKDRFRKWRNIHLVTTRVQ